MGLYRHLRDLWNNPTDEARQAARERLLAWRHEPATIRVERPTRLDRARTLGYKAKPGILVVRARLARGGRMRPDIKKGRRSKHAGQRKVLSKSYQQVAEERVSKRYPNCEVVGSYEAAKDGMHYWFEVIVVDREHPVTKTSVHANLAKRKGRALRGLTSASRKGRGMRGSGKGHEKARPSHRSNSRRQS